MRNFFHHFLLNVVLFVPYFTCFEFEFVIQGLVDTLLSGKLAR